MAFSEIRVRMKDGHKLYSETKLTSSNDVVFLFGSKMDEYRDNTMAVLNINTKGQIINIDIGSLNHFRKHIRETVKRTILSNAGYVYIVANGADSYIKRMLAREYQAVYETFNMPMADFICKNKNGYYMSYGAKDIIHDTSAMFGSNFDAGSDGDMSDRDNISQIEMKRISEIEGVVTSHDAISHVQNELRSFDREVLYIICHDKYGRPSDYYMVSMGDLSSSMAHPREVFKGAILSDADSITMLHNHPSGDCTPSPADDEAALTMQYCGAVLGINLKDSLIVGKDVYSYEEQGRLLGQDGGYSSSINEERDFLKGEEKKMANEQNFTQTLLKHLEDGGYTLEVHGDKLRIVDIEGSEPFWEEITLEYVRENACSRLEEDIKKNGEYYRKNGELDALKDDLEFLRGYDINAAGGKIYEELRQKTAEARRQREPTDMSAADGKKPSVTINQNKETNKEEKEMARRIDWNPTMVFNGRLIKDPQMRTIQSNGKEYQVADYAVAVSDTAAKETSKGYKASIIMNCNAFGSLAEEIGSYKQGDIVTGAYTMRAKIVPEKDGRPEFVTPSYTLDALDKTNTLHRQMNRMLNDYSNGEIEQLYELPSKEGANFDQVPEAELDNFAQDYEQQKSSQPQIEHDESREAEKEQSMDM